MAAPDNGVKVSQAGVINNILQWSLLFSVCIYLVLTRRESMSSMEQMNSRVLQNEGATTRNDVRIAALERIANKLSWEHAMLGKTELRNVLFGWYQLVFSWLPLIPPLICASPTFSQ